MGGSGRNKRPRRGSLGYSPRKRASKIVPTVNSWPEVDDVKILDFPGYKVGMSHVLRIDDRKYTLTKGKEMVVPVTVVETPPIYVCGVRAYKKTPYGLKTVTESWAEGPKELSRSKTVSKNPDKDLSKIQSLIEGGKVDDLRAIVCTQPKLIHLKKKPEVMESGIGGKDVKAKLEYLKGVFGKELKVTDILTEGEFVDVVSVTKGKGFQGVIRRWGVKIQDRKVNDARRHVGSIGPWHPPKVMWTVPFAGQMGFHTRTELNKRIFRITNPKDLDITPKEGFKNYGLLKSDYAMLKGSVGGSTKRILRLRKSIRVPERRTGGSPDITFFYKATTGEA
ncbi:MAG: 50S ribosomal protein L3 [Candidatus Methanofastidiosum methylothiophilum]|uniref:Large ribosomal subunit protein uL3 n=1 Tax=Candidatus Methanofastidiosum methylothiophilum TaxID=1705564 RepID=A0A150IY92_9EURY|nr:MAG: 50S ribosomal protein L3 [Candidatus Methanofastidiosum methylthiophilus]NMC77053.1 50S ribosomal protein L3 [Candidatus Methanofastidiosa archaeon]